MKKYFLILFAALITCFTAFSQTYRYSTKTIKALVQTSNGNQQRIIGKYSGPYIFKFENPNDYQIKRIFTLMSPGQYDELTAPWYGLLKEMGYVEKEGVTFKKYLYTDTESGENVLVLLPDDYSMIVIFRKDDTVWEFNK